MSIWVSVYCQKRVGSLDPTGLIAGVKDRLEFFSDLYAQEDPNEVLARLNAKIIQSGKCSQLLHLHYLEDDLPIVMDWIGDHEIVAGGSEEYLSERFHDRQGVAATRVREHLAKTVEQFNFCLKQRHADGMGTPLVYAAAAWLAAKGDGLLRADEQGWMELDGGEWHFICDE